MSAQAAQATIQINPDEVDINLTLKLKQVIVLLKALDEIPHGVARPIHEYLNHQANVQVGAILAKQQEEAEAARKAEEADKAPPREIADVEIE